MIVVGFLCYASLASDMSGFLVPGVALAVVSDILVLSGVAGYLILAVIVVGSLWSDTAGGRIRISVLLRSYQVLRVHKSCWWSYSVFGCCISVAIRNMAVQGVVWNA